MHPAQVPTVSLDELPADATILDVREDEEWNAGHVDGARHVPMNQVPNWVSYGEDAPDPSATTYVMCKGGGRSAQVTAWLVANGYDAVNVEGGMLAWATAGRPMTSESGNPPYVA